MTRLDEELLRYSIGTLLAAAGSTIMVYLWYIDLVALQRVFGALLAAGLVIFAMALYVFSKQTLTGKTNTWLLVGCLGAASLLLMAVQLGTS
jgi:peptidoglycan/LPS O-acetylase OafA/YrhL